jgi:hypothetical protein
MWVSVEVSKMGIQVLTNCKAAASGQLPAAGRKAKHGKDSTEVDGRNISHSPAVCVSEDC